MLVLQDLFAAYGPLVLIGLGFLEFIGVPLASTPFIIAVASLAPSGPVPFVALPLLVTTGALAADALWFGAARRRGKRVVDYACGLTANPMVCAVKLQKRVGALEGRSLLLAKLVPGLANVVAAAAGLSRVPPRRFFVFDVMGLLIWSTLVTGLGWVFSDQLEVVLRFAAGYARIVFGAIAGLLILGAVARVQKIRMHRGYHVREGRAR